MRAVLFQLVILSIIHGVGAAVLFSDDFTRPADSYTRWITVFNNDYGSIKFVQGQAVLEDSDYTYSGMAFHVFPSPSTDFTFSGFVSSAYANAGFYLCLTTNPQLTGYAVQIGRDGSITVLKYAAGSSPVIFNVFSPFINIDPNRVSISKSGSFFLVKCNGFYVGHFSDNSYASGNIGFFVPPGSIAAFDDIVVSDSILDSVFTGVFADPFSDTVEWGWNGRGNGVWGSDQGVFSIQTGRYQTCSRYLDLRLRDFRVSTTVSLQDSSTNFRYGLLLREPGADSGIVDHQFAINGGGQYWMGFADSSPVPLTGAMGQNVKCMTTVCFDTLTLVREGNNPVVFLVNGDTIGSVAVPAIIDGAGFFASESLHVHFDSFFVQGSNVNGSPVKRITFSGNVRPVDSRTFHCAQVDMLGRTIIRHGETRSLLKINFGNRNNVFRKGVDETDRGVTPLILLPLPQGTSCTL
jgi:hypothetical protein